LNDENKIFKKMSEPENIKLKKEILRLKELNSQLQEENETLNEKIGQLKLINISNKNKNELINKTKLLSQNKEILRTNIEEAIFEEKQKLEKIQKENETLKQNLKLYENKLLDNELYIQKLQQENNNIKRQLINFNNNNFDSKNIINNQRNIDDLLSKKEQEYQKLTIQWNELLNNMELVLGENRILRQMADVPDNFGIDISKIKMGDRVKIEDYKAKIRILQRDINDLESERAQLKNKLLFLSNYSQSNEEPFNLLTKEQKIEVAKYAQDLYEGKKNIQPEKYELMKQINYLNTKIAILEEENNKFKNGFYKNNNNGNNDDLKELVRSIVKEEKDIMGNNQKLYNQNFYNAKVNVNNSNFNDANFYNSSINNSSINNLNINNSKLNNPNVNNLSFNNSNLHNSNFNNQIYIPEILHDTNKRNGKANSINSDNSSQNTNSKIFL
jgi:hypothetical protein